MQHAVLTLNHRLESWVYANATARTTATGFAPSDPGRIAYQTDTGQYWRLIDTSPTWALISVLPVYASVQTAIANPTGITGTTTKMLGLAAMLTPVVTGKVCVTIALGAFYTSGGAFVSTTQMRYGTLPAPANGAAVAGTAAGTIAQTPVGPATTCATITVILTGLAVGTQYWFDLAATSLNVAGGVNAVNVTVTAVELP